MVVLEVVGGVKTAALLQRQVVLGIPQLPHHHKETMAVMVFLGRQEAMTKPVVAVVGPVLLEVLHHRPIQVEMAATELPPLFLVHPQHMLAVVAAVFV